MDAPFELRKHIWQERKGPRKPNRNPDYPCPRLPRGRSRSTQSIRAQAGTREIRLLCGCRENHLNRDPVGRRSQSSITTLQTSITIRRSISTTVCCWPTMASVRQKQTRAFISRWSTPLHPVRSKCLKLPSGGKFTGAVPIVSVAPQRRKTDFGKKAISGFSSFTLTQCSKRTHITARRRREFCLDTLQRTKLDRA